MQVVFTVVVLVPLVACIVGDEQLKCMKCSKGSKKSCDGSQTSVSCKKNDACFFTVTLEKGRKVKYEKGCWNKNACWSHQLRNMDQCREGYVSSACTYCCDSNDCFQSNLGITFKKADECDAWSAWGSCSASCGIGLHARSRDCRGYKASSGSKRKKRHSGSKSDKSAKSEVEKAYEFGICIAQPCSETRRQSCQTCETPTGVFSNFNCQGEPTLCEEGQNYCLVEYSTSNTLPHVSKKCASQSACAAANADGENWSDVCKHFLDTFSVSSKISTSSTAYTTVNSIVGGTVGDAATAIKKFTQMCAVCCEGDGCDRNFMPPWNSVLGSASTLRMASLFLLVPLLVFIA